MSNGVELSIVAPAYNEAGNLECLVDQVATALEATHLTWEFILVDDGSTDNSRDIIHRLNAREPRVKGIFLSRNFGHEIASTAGLDLAQGNAVVLMDADLQDPPEIIPILIEKWREGYDIVSAQRISRQGESIFKKITAFLFYRIMGSLIKWRLPRDTGDFRLMSRTALDAFLRCRERNRFVRALAAWTGFRQTTVPFERSGRYSGETKYTVRKLFELAFTSITSFSIVPLRLALWTGGIALAIGIVLLILAIIAIMARTTYWGVGLVLASVWLLGGIQCLLIGILGEYVGRTYFEAQRRPLYFVGEYVGIEPHGPTS